MGRDKGGDDDARPATEADLAAARAFAATARHNAMFFDAHDLDRNRTLDFVEFSKLVREREMGVHTEEALRKRFKQLDADGSGELEMGEFIKFALRDALQRSAARVTDLLHAWDADGDGSIDKSEFRRAVATLGFDALDEEVDGVFEEMDTNRSGTLELREVRIPPAPAPALRLLLTHGRRTSPHAVRRT